MPNVLTARRAGKAAASALQKGFTLLEMLVVLVIIGLLAGLVGPQLMGRVDTSRQTAAETQGRMLKSALDTMRLDIGRYPNSSEGLAALVQRPGSMASWNGPYLKGSVVPNDPWGNAYVYRSPGRQGPYDIVSYGADGQEGGAGLASDIANGTH